MQNIKRKQSLFDQTFSQRATTTAESRRTYRVPKQAIDFKNKFETYLSGQTSCIDVIKYNNTLPTKKYKQNILLKRKTTHIGTHFFQQEPIVDYNNIKEFISDHEHYSELNRVLKTQQSLQERKSLQTRTSIKSDYQENKRLNHFNLMADEYRSQIKSNNLVSSPEKLFKNKIKARTKQIVIIRQKYVKIDLHLILEKCKHKLKHLSCRMVVNSHLLIFFQKTTSDHFMDTLQMNCNIQSDRLHQFGDLDFIELENNKLQTERTPNNAKQSMRQMRHLLKRNGNCPNTQDEGLIDESVISETEAKLNQYYGQSKDFQKKILNKNENPNKVINLINKVDQIREQIYKVNTNKLYGL